jgi:glycosyltransferase involved in cell wall biosynthesis
MNLGPAHTSENPLVTVVISTLGRPHLITRAVKSALSQTLSNIEVVVVIDGPDKNTEEALQQVHDHRLRYTMHTENRGLPSGRNTGVSLARADWVAFLDDDDLWMPEKLEVQFRTAESSQQHSPVIACRVAAQDQRGEYVWPRRCPGPDEDLSEYLFCRKTPFWGEGLVLPSAMFVSRKLLLRVPFSDGLQMNDDIDWLLRARSLEDIVIEFVPNDCPLAVWSIQENRERMSTSCDWQYSLSWIRSQKHLVTSRAYFSYVLSWVGMRAARSRDWKAFPVLIREAFLHGTASWNDIVYFIGIWLLPSSFRQWLALQYGRLFRKAFRQKGQMHA